MALAQLISQQSACGLHWELITDFSRLEYLATEWERLFISTNPPGGIFQSWSWARAFWRVHGHEMTLCSPAVFAGDTMIGILPVATHGHMAQLLGAPYADYNGLLCAPEHEAHVFSIALAALLATSIPWTKCVFENIPESSVIVQQRRLLPSPLQAHLQFVSAYSCPAALDNGGQFFDHLARKESLRRHETRLAKQGSIRFRHIENRDELLASLPLFYAMHIARLAIRGVRSPFLLPDTQAMIRALVTDFNPARELRFSVLELNDRPVAYHLGFQHAGKLISYAPTFDIDYWDDGPGEVLFRKLFKYAHEQRLTEFDFTIGDESYKNRFANHVRQTFTVHFDRVPLQPQVVISRMGRRVRDIVRRSPNAARYARQILAVLRSLAKRLRDPAALAHSASIGFSRLFTVQRIVICHSAQPVPTPHEVTVTRVTLKDFAGLPLRFAPIDYAAIAAFRRRVKHGDALYLSRVRASQFLFWVGADGGADAGALAVAKPETVISEGPALNGAIARDMADAIAALLRVAEFSGDIWICVRRNVDVEAALRRSGYRLRAQLRRISLLGRTRFAQLVRPVAAIIAEGKP